MTNGISINQFSTQIQDIQNTDTKIKLDEKGDLKTYGNNVFGKLACWLQPKSSRVDQNNTIMKSFIKAIKNEYGSEITGDIIKNLETQKDKRLSARTVSTTITDLNNKRETTSQANIYASNIYSEINPMKHVPRDGYFENNFKSVKNDFQAIGFDIETLIKMKEKSIEPLQEKVSQSIRTAGKEGQHHVSSNEANKITRLEIQAHVFNSNIDLLIVMLYSKNNQPALDYINNLPQEEQKQLTKDYVKEIAPNFMKELMRGEDTKSRMGKLTPSMRSEVTSYIIKNAPINTVNEAVTLLSQLNRLSSGNVDKTLQRVFDHFIDQDGGLAKLRDCSNQLMSMELQELKESGKLNNSTLLRGNSLATKIATKILVHMTKAANKALTERLIQLDPQKFPPAKIENSDFDSSKAENDETNPRKIDKPEFSTLKNTMTKTCLNEINGLWLNALSNETKTFFSEIKETVNKFKSELGKGAGNQAVGALMILRLLNPVVLLRQETLSNISKQITDLKKSITPENKEEIDSQINSLEGKKTAILDVSKRIQLLANSIGKEDYQSYVTNTTKDKNPGLLTFMMGNQGGLDKLVENVSTPTTKTVSKTTKTIGTPKEFKQKVFQEMFAKNKIDFSSFPKNGEITIDGTKFAYSIDTFSSKGSGAKVLKVNLKNPDQLQEETSFVVKAMEHEALDFLSQEQNQIFKSKLLEEVNTTKDMAKDENSIDFYGSYELDLNNGNSMVVYGMEYCDMDLSKYVDKGEHSVKNVQQILQKVAKSLANLHANGRVHGDMKGDNIYMVGGEPRLADYGESVSKGNQQFETKLKEEPKLFAQMALDKLKLLGYPNPQQDSEFVNVLNDIMNDKNITEFSMVEYAKRLGKSLEN